MFVRASCVAIAGIAAVEAFNPTALLHPTTSSRGVPAVSMVARGGDSAVGRRQAFALLSTLPLVLGSVSPAEAKKAAIKLNSEGQPETPEERRERIKHSPSRTHSDHPFRPIRRSGGGRSDGNAATPLRFAMHTLAQIVCFFASLQPPLAHGAGTTPAPSQVQCGSRAMRCEV